LGRCGFDGRRRDGRCELSGRLRSGPGTWIDGGTGAEFGLRRRAGRIDGWPRKEPGACGTFLHGGKQRLAEFVRGSRFVAGRRSWSYGALGFGRLRAGGTGRGGSFSRGAFFR
jgi:hypothetical protein